MFAGPPKESPHGIGFVLVPRFSMIAFTAAIEPLRLANHAKGQKLYDWSLFTVDGKAVTASNGIELQPAGDLKAAADLDTIVVCSGLDVHLAGDKALLLAASGDVFVAGSGFDVLVGVRAPDSAEAADLSGLYFAAGLRLEHRI